MDLRKVKKLIELFEDSELVEMEISEGESTIRLNRGTMTSSAMMQAPPVSAPAMVVEATSASNYSSVIESDSESGDKINSPMVGTFYDAPSPGTDPYVGVGTVVKPGDVLCIIEAMKTFNHVEAEVGGTIKAIYKKSGDPVEFGEPLFLID